MFSSRVLWSTKRGSSIRSGRSTKVKRKVLPVGVGVGQEAHPAVGSPVRSAKRVEQPHVADVADRGLERVTAMVLDEVERHHRLEHRHLDRLPLAGAELVDHRGQHGLGDRHPANLVGDDRRHEAGRAVDPLVQVDQARRRLDHVVVGGAVGVGPTGPEPVGDAVDQARMASPEGGGVEPEPFEGRAAHVRHHHVGAGHQLRCGGRSLGLLEVESDAALVALQVEGEAVHPRRAGRWAVAGALRRQRLDADDVGAVVGQHPGRHGAHEDRGEVDQANAVERAGCGTAVTHPDGH